MSIADLKAKAKEEAEKEKARQRELYKTTTALKATSRSPAPPGQSAETTARDGPVPVKSVRKDSSPVKVSEIMCAASYSKLKYTIATVLYPKCTPSPCNAAYTRTNICLMDCVSRIAVKRDRPRIHMCNDPSGPV